MHSIRTNPFKSKCPLVSDILAWLESAGNIVFKADGLIDR